MPDTASTTDPVAMTVAIVALLIGLGVLALLVLVLVGIAMTSSLTGRGGEGLLAQCAPATT